MMEINFNFLSLIKVNLCDQVYLINLYLSLIFIVIFITKEINFKTLMSLILFYVEKIPIEY